MKTIKTQIVEKPVSECISARSAFRSNSFGFSARLTRIPHSLSLAAIALLLLQPLGLAQVDITGDVNPNPAVNPTWNVGGILFVGQSGTGTMTVDTDGTVSNTSGRIGLNAGSNGTATVTGGTWTNSGQLFVGFFGTGILSISNGGTVSNTFGFIGHGTGSDGTVTVSGGTWTNSDLLVVGNAGTGSLSVSGGTVTATSVSMGNNGGAGTVNLNGGVLATGQVSEGIGTGTVTFSGGTLRLTGNQGDLFAGFEAGDVTLVGAGGTIDTQTFSVASAYGLSGNGSLTKQGNGTLTLTGTNTYTGGTTVRNGALTVTGGISHTSATMTVGNSSGDNASLNISGTGTVSNTSGFIGNDTGSNGTVTVSGGTWANSNFLFVGNSGDGTLNLSGGTVSNTRGLIGNDTGSNGTVTVSGGNWTNSDQLFVGNAGTGSLSVSNGTVSNTSGRIGNSIGSNGTVTVSGGNWTNSDFLLVGNRGTGSLSVSGGTVSATSVRMGERAGSTGTLNIGTGGTAGTLSTDSVRGGLGTAVVNFNHTGNLTFSPILEFSLTVNKLGTGTTTLSSPNTYTGGTTINAGMLRTTNTTALGTGPVTINAGGTLDPVGQLNINSLTWNGGTIASSLGTTTDLVNSTGALTLASPGTFAFTPGVGFLAATPYQILSASNMDTYTVADFAGNILFGRMPTFSIGGNDLFVSFISSGSGPPLQNSAPVNTPVFADFVVNGAASTGNPAESNIVNALIFDPSSSLQVFNDLVVTSGEFTVAAGSASINGGTVNTPGGFTKLGAGALDATSTFNVAGPANIEGGALIVNGRFTAGGGLTVFQSALLGGSGVINANVINNGTISPGNSPGTLTINGDFTQNAGGTLLIEIANLNVFDRLIVTGAASLAGTLQVADLGGQLAFGQQYEILQAGSINGTFDDIEISDPARFRGRFLINGGTGTLLIAPASYTLVARNQNERNVARALNGFIPQVGNDQEQVSIALDRLTVAQYPAAFNAIMPGFHSSLLDITIEQTFAQTQMLNQRLSSVRLGIQGNQAFGMNTEPLIHDKDGKSVADSKGVKTLIAPESDPRWSVWTQGNGMFAKITQVNQVPNYRFQSGGVMVGTDYRWSENFTTGLYGGYQGTYADYESAGSARINSALFGGYATYTNGAFYADGVIGGGYSNYQVRRGINFSTIDRTARSNQDGGQFTSAINLGYDWKAAGFTFGPILGAQYTYAGMNRFTETGAESLDLAVGGQSAGSLRSTLGARVAYTWNVCQNVTIIPEVRALWQHEFLNSTRAINASLDGGNGPSFDFNTATPGQDSLFGAAGITAQIGKTWNANLYYNVDVGRQDYLSHMVSGGLGISF